MMTSRVVPDSYMQDMDPRWGHGAVKRYDYPHWSQLLSWLHGPEAELLRHEDGFWRLKLKDKATRHMRKGKVWKTTLPPTDFIVTERKFSQASVLRVIAEAGEGDFIFTYNDRMEIIGVRYKACFS